MLRLNRYIGMLLLGTIVQSCVWAQTKNAIPRSVANLFNDLPVNDASASSVLYEGETAAEKITSNIFVTTSLNTRECFVGEPVLFTATLYSALQSRSVIQAAPKLPGFVTTELTIDNERPQYKKIAGKNYRVFSIRRLQLLPVQEGALTIEPLVVNNTIRYTDENDKQQAYSGTVYSEPVKLTVKPLPQKGRPAAFAELVGKFSMLVTVQRSRMVAGEADTLQIDITGSGNFTDCKLPAIAWPGGVEHLPAKEHLNLNADSFPFAGNKTFNIPFVASEPGKLVIPAISLAYFDPARANYETINSTAIDIDVLPAVVEKRVAPVAKTSTNNNRKIGSAAVALILIMAIIYYVRKRSYKVMEALEQTTGTQQEIVPVNYNSMIQDLQAVQPAEQYLVAFKNILYTFIEQELNITRRSEEALVNRLRQQQSPLALEVQQLFTVCNRLLYSPGDINEMMKQEMEAQLERIVKKVMLT